MKKTAGIQIRSCSLSLFHSLLLSLLSLLSLFHSLLLSLLSLSLSFSLSLSLSLSSLFPLLSSLSSLLPSVSGGMMPLASPRSTSVGLGIIAQLRAELHLRVASEWDSHRSTHQVLF